jgi:hypothetical protein
LLGTHVQRRAEGHAGLGDRRVLRGALHARDAEVRDDGKATLEEDVLRLDVPMDDALVVGPVERAQDFDADADRRVNRQRPLARHAVAQRFAAHERHDVVQQTARFA